MIKKVKTGLIIFAVLFLAGTVITVNIQTKKIKRLKLENTRLDNNNYQLMSDNRKQTNLVLKEKEVTGKLKRERDSLAKSLQIKPKNITEIKYQTITIRDTVKVPVPVAITGKNEWLLRDSTKCLKYVAKLVLKGDSLIAERQLLEDNNRITETFYRVRPHKFLFIKFGKWVYKQKIDSECGETTIKTFTFIK